MIAKKYHKNGKACRVTFTLPKEVNAQQASICGEFNDWSETGHPMKRRKDGSFTLGITLKKGDYRFRYFLDGDRWENDSEADEYVPNEYGSEDAVIKI